MHNDTSLHRRIVPLCRFLFNGLNSHATPIHFRRGTGTERMKRSASVSKRDVSPPPVKRKIESTTTSVWQRGIRFSDGADEHMQVRR